MSEYWTLQEVAERLGLSEGTVSGYRSRGRMPKPDQQFGRTPLWKPETIAAWRMSQRRRIDKEESAND